MFLLTRVPVWNSGFLSHSHLGCGSKPMGSHFGVGEFTTHFRTYFSGDWDVHRDYGVLTHSHLGVEIKSKSQGKRQVLVFGSIYQAAILVVFEPLPFGCAPIFGVGTLVVGFKGKRRGEPPFLGRSNHKMDTPSLEGGTEPGASNP